MTSETIVTLTVVFCLVILVASALVFFYLDDE